MEIFTHKWLSETEYSLPRLSQDKFLIQFESWACNEQERMTSRQLWSEKFRMTFEAGKRWGEGTMRNCTGWEINQITLKYTDVSLTPVSQACSYGGEKQTHYMALVVMLHFFKFHGQPRKKKKEKNNSYSGLPAVKKRSKFRVWQRTLRYQGMNMWP